MGLSPFARCSTNCAPATVATNPPNPNPKRWEIVSVFEYASAYVLLVRYLDCTNYEGLKVMVYRGKWREHFRSFPLDPHFRPGPGGPIARFRPDPEGMKLANELAEKLSEGGPNALGTDS